MVHLYRIVSVFPCFLCCLTLSSCFRTCSCPEPKPDIPPYYLSDANQNRNKEPIRTVLLVDDTPPECPVAVTFDNYPGFENWYRFPLQYPYQIIMIDTFDNGILKKYIGGDIRNPNVSSKPVISGITAIIRRKEALVFRSISPDRKEPVQYGIFFYATGKLEWFRDEPAAKTFLKQSGKVEFVSLEKSYHEFIQRQN